MAGKQDVLITAFHLPYLEQACRERGVSLQSLYKDTEIDCERIGRVDYFISIKSYDAVIGNALKLTNEPTLALSIGSTLSIVSYGVFGSYTLNSITGLDAVKAAVNMSQLFMPFIQMELISEEDCYRLLFHKNYDFPQQTYFFDLMMSSCLKVCRDIVEDAASYMEFKLAYPKPFEDTLCEKYEVILGENLEWDAPVCEIQFTKEILEKELSHFDPVSKTQQEKVTNKKLDSILGEKSTADRVKALLEKNFKQNLSLDNVASSLNLSKRSLGRKLSEEGTSFREIVIEERTKLSKTMLLNSTLQITEIADELGFDDVSSFNRAFKKWTGMSPGEFRKNHSL